MIVKLARNALVTFLLRTCVVMILGCLMHNLRRFYRDAVGVLLVYDTTYRATFKHLEKTLQKVREMTNAKIPIILVGNKCDKEYARSVPATEGKAFASTLLLCCIPCLIYFFKSSGAWLSLRHQL